MQKILFYGYKFIKRVYRFLILGLNNHFTIILFYINNIKFKSIKSNGIPHVQIDRNSKCEIGSGFRMNNGIKNNTIGCYQKCTIRVSKNAALSIGNNVGISQSALICHYKIIIEDNVKIGGGCYIYDTDFHSIYPEDRLNRENDIKNRKCSSILIKNNAFIGAHSIILKGVTIGENAIIGAGSVVAKDIPENEIWAGNPIMFIKKIKQ